MTENTDSPVLKKVATIVDDFKNTELHYSAANGNEKDLQTDLDNDHKIDVENFLGWTPLMMACRNGHLSIVQTLLKNRADATKKNRYGMSVFLVSITSGNLEIVRLILQHLLCGGVSRQSMQKIFSPLSLAILFCHQDIVKYLIEQNFDLNAVTPITGITPLMFASAMENCEAFTLLLTKGVDTTLKNYSGFTAHGIIESRNQKADVKRTEPKIPTNPQNVNVQMQPPQTPLPPYIVISPQPTFYPLQSTNQFVNPHITKSSNTMSPGYYFATPNITPITPLNFIQPPQMFFPPEFSPSQIYGASPVPNYYNTNDILNARLNPNNVFMSPLPQNVNYPSPCV